MPRHIRAIKKHKAATTCTRYFATRGTCFLGSIVDSVNAGIADTFGHMYLMKPTKIENFPNMVYVSLQESHFHLHGLFFEFMHRFYAIGIFGLHIFLLFLDNIEIGRAHV